MPRNGIILCRCGREHFEVNTSRIIHCFCLVGLLFLSTSIRAADTNAVLDAWFAAQTKLKTWSADFTQTRSLKTLTQPLVATGHIWFAKPNQFRWELGDPPRTIALRELDQMWVIYPRLKRAEHYPLGGSQPREWRDAMSLLNAGFPHQRSDFEAEFRVLSLVETNAAWRMTLQPKSSFARNMLPEIRVDLATNDFSLMATELVFTDDSRMRNDFTNAVLNPDVATNFFHWEAPADFKVTAPFAK